MSVHPEISTVELIFGAYPALKTEAQKDLLIRKVKRFFHDTKELDGLTIKIDGVEVL